MGMGGDRDSETLTEGAVHFPLSASGITSPPRPTYYRRMQTPCYEITMTSTPLLLRVGNWLFYFFLKLAFLKCLA